MYQICDAIRVVRIVTTSSKIVYFRNMCTQNSDRLQAGRSAVGTPAGARFSIPSKTGPDAYPLSCTVSLPGSIAVGRGADLPPPFSAGVEHGQCCTSV